MCGGGGGWRSESSRTGSSGSSGDPAEEEDQREFGDFESENPCLINRRTELRNTDSDILDGINIGDVFPVEVRDGRPCVVDYDGQIIGSILESLGELILDCVEEGNGYRAEIIEIENQRCEVRVSNKCYIDEEVMLASPNPDVLDEVTEGEVLDVVVSEESLCVVNDSERVVGSIAKPWTRILIQCIDSELEYEATVVTIDGGDCRVHINNTHSDE